MPLSLGALPRPQSIVAQWLLSEAASAVRVDQTENDNDLQDNNSVTQGTGHEGGADKCASFASANTEYLSIADALATGLDGMNSMTVSCWIKAVSASGFIVCKGVVGATVAYYFQITAAPAIQINVGDGGATSANISTGTWYHVAFRSIASGELAVFINGVKSGSQGSAPASVSDNNEAFTLGAQRNGATPYNGLIDEVVVWNVALTDTEIKQVATGSAGGAATMLFL